MNSWVGKVLSYEIFGESHSEKIGIKVKGLPCTKIDKKSLSEFLKRRSAVNKAYSTKRFEKDEIEYSAGVDENDCIRLEEVLLEIRNLNVKSQDYNELEGKPRPSHADYCSFVKWGRTDFRGGHEFSGRMTAPLCILGGISKQILKDTFGIDVTAYVSKIGTVEGVSYKQTEITKQMLETVSGESWALGNQSKMEELMQETSLNSDSVGGAIECIVNGLPAGIGDAGAEGLESKISQIVFGIPAVKGIEFGRGCDLASLNGSVANDEFYFDDNGIVKTYTNNSGGINGGISNGMPITMRVSFRPTPSISKTQNTVDLINKKNIQINIKGRHDSCFVPRAVPVVESTVAIALLDSLLEENKNGQN